MVCMSAPNPRTRTANQPERLGCENFRLIWARQGEADPLLSVEAVADKSLNVFAPGTKVLTSFPFLHPRVPQ
jgi:hypothetical protein